MLISLASASSPTSTPSAASTTALDNLLRVKRGGGGYPGAGGGAAGPVYICGYIGGKEGTKPEEMQSHYTHLDTRKVCS